MLIDGFTVSAQVVNFIVLVWLLKRFLYKPVLDAIDAREARVAKDVADAAASVAEAASEREGFERRSAELERERGGVLTRAREEADAERQRLLEAARAEVEGARARWLDALRDEQESLHQALGQKARDEVFAITRKVLLELADEQLEERIVRVFVQRLRALSGDERGRLSTALAASQGVGADGALVRSAFELTVAQRASIQDALRQVFGAGSALRFEVAPTLVGGVELAVGGQKVAWSIGEYLLLLERGVSELLDQAGP